jgi:hypothetical protein
VLAASSPRLVLAALSPLYGGGPSDDDSGPSCLFVGADGVFIVTSSRLDHFRDSDAAAVLTADCLGRMLSSLGASK